MKSSPSNCSIAPIAARRSYTDIAVSLAFLAFIIVPTLLIALVDNRSDIAVHENREASAFPSIECSPRFGGLWKSPKSNSMKEFPRAFESWFNDHFGLRRRFVQLYSLAKYTGMATQQLSVPTGTRSPQSEVVLGRSGRLFLCCQRTLDDFRRVKTVDERVLNAWQSMLENRAKWLQRRGIPYIVLACPNGQTIYPEYMPRSIKQLDRPSTLDQLIARLRASGIVTILDPREMLVHAKATREVYYKTDSHWNDYGAYLGYRMLMEQIARHHPAAAPISLDCFTLEEADVPSSGNLAKMIDSPLLLRDLQVRMIPHPPFRARQETIRRPQAGEENQFYIYVASNPEAPPGAAVVLCDSFFANVMAPFNEHFQTVHYEAMGRHDKPLPVSAIERLRPVVVVQEFVERALVLYDSLDEQSELIEPEEVPYLAAPLTPTMMR